MRVACPPRLWPFLDYPMYSTPHRRGDVLAWIDVRIQSLSGVVESRGLYEVRRATADEPLEIAEAREEARLRAVFRAELELRPAGTRLVLQRDRLVLTERGLVPPGMTESAR